jgi:hypothetical protein
LTKTVGHACGRVGVDDQDGERGPHRRLYTEESSFRGSSDKCIMSDLSDLRWCGAREAARSRGVRHAGAGLQVS